MTLEDMEAAKSIPNVVEVAGTRELPMTVVAGGVERPVNLVGVTEGYQVFRRLLILRGRCLDAGDVDMRRKFCLIPTYLADRIFMQANPIGRSVHISVLTFSVIGEVPERGENLGIW